MRLIGEVAPDHTVTLTVVRNGGEMEIPVTMGERKSPVLFSGDFNDAPLAPLPPNVVIPNLPSAPSAPFPPTAPRVRVMPRTGSVPDSFEIFGFYSGRTIGVGVTGLTPQLGEYFGVREGKGLLVNSVSKDSPAERAGLKAGDVIVEVDGKPVLRQMDLVKAFGDEKKGDVVITIVRNKNRQSLTVSPEARKSGNSRFNGLEFKTREVN
jgi:S1-C subfamily serine protease